MKGSVECPWDNIHRPTQTQKGFEDHGHVRPEGLAKSNDKAEDRNSAVGVIHGPGIADPSLDHVCITCFDDEKDARAAIKQIRIVQVIFDGFGSQLFTEVSQVASDEVASRARLDGANQAR